MKEEVKGQVDCRGKAAQTRQMGQQRKEVKLFWDLTSYFLFYNGGFVTKHKIHICLTVEIIHNRGENLLLGTKGG